MSEYCQALHQLLNSLPPLRFPFSETDIPSNGIYVFFEKGEFAHHTHRIVRIGTHTGDNNLNSRLKEHFVNEVKDRSIFRKNIGRCLLKNDPFLKEWELTPLIKEIQRKNPNIDYKKQRKVERQVSTIIRNNFTVSVFPVKNKKRRLILESKIISTISDCTECMPSKNWLGLTSPLEKIRTSGLWQVNELWKEPLSHSEMKELNQIISLQKNKRAV